MITMATGRATSAPHGKRIVLAHGGGGQLTDELIAHFVSPRLDNPVLSRLEDSAILDIGGSRLAFTTDSFVVQPLEFPGGDIGRLAVSGTVNDLAVCGAEPAAISLALILEEGLDVAVFRRVLDSVAETAREAAVTVVTGDTKVVGKGQADGMYINTSGIGIVRSAHALGIEQIQPGDVVLVSGTIADHGFAVMLQREEGIGIESVLQSDAAPLNGMIRSILAEVEGVVFMRDPTRGGLAGVLADLAERSGFHLAIDESGIPVQPATRYTAELLGIEPLDVANEGKVVIVVRPHDARRTLELLRKHPRGKQAACIGTFESTRDGLCELLTDVGGRRILQKPYGEELPRIC